MRQTLELGNLVELRSIRTRQATNRSFTGLFWSKPESGIVDNILQDIFQKSTVLSANIACSSVVKQDAFGKIATVIHPIFIFLISNYRNKTRASKENTQTVSGKKKTTIILKNT